MRHSIRGTFFFDQVPQLALTQKIIPALATIVGSSGSVHQLAQEEGKALFLADQEHKQNMKKRADGVADIAGMNKNHGNGWGNFTEVVGKPKRGVALQTK